VAEFRVTNATQLSSALSQATGGDIIKLASGNYGSFGFKNYNFTSPVTVISEDAGNLASFNNLEVRSSKNLSLVSLDVGRPLAAGEPDFTKMAAAFDSTNITFDRIRFHGSLDGDPTNDGRGLHVSNVTGLVLKDSSFEQLRIGLIVERSNLVKIVGNDVHDIALDGFEIAGTNNLVVDGNTFDRFFPLAGDHPDAIQLFNTNMPTGSSNITITNNVMLQTAGKGPQGIFISDPGTFGFTNVLVKNNLLYGNEQYNGITVKGGRGVAIVDNTVLSKEGDAASFWIRLQDTDNVLVQNNLTEDIVVLTGVTKLALVDNVNLKVTPWEKAGLNLISPSEVAHLMRSDVGYGSAAVQSAAPVSSAAGNSLGALFGTPIGGASLSETLDFSGLEESAISSDVIGVRADSLDPAFPHLSPLPDFSGHDAHIGPMFGSRYIPEHFVAIP
jgi:hypothetical protein